MYRLKGVSLKEQLIRGVVYKLGRCLVVSDVQTFPIEIKVYYRHISLARWALWRVSRWPERALRSALICDGQPAGGHQV